MRSAGDESARLTAFAVVDSRTRATAATTGIAAGRLLAKSDELYRRGLRLLIVP
jgi:hypothetical protein